MDYILDFEELDKSSLPSVGGKNASLGEMIKAGIRVPPGFAVTTDSYL
ncbi:MAG: PEP/pyruvate-binding domain-containing protein, partial [Candidatus Marinimicrobia bacterium]|nr:PEP/pyruvate-binding domain-containing protein [Candidatus Neomarinimicrobiota bacterium]